MLCIIALFLVPDHYTEGRSWVSESVFPAVNVEAR